jgi:hypothetical protein
LQQLEHLRPFRALALSGMIYIIWQLLYWKVGTVFFSSLRLN